MKYSVLDLCPVPEGSDTAQAIANTVDLARHAEAWGYHRHWMAEHHNMPGVASSATSILIGHVAASDKDHPRRGRGHHAPEPRPACHRRTVRHPRHDPRPARIDLGLGRAPGGDMAGGPRASPRHGHGRPLPRRRGRTPGLPRPVRRHGPRPAPSPARGTEVPVWILGCCSSTARSSRPTSACLTPSPPTSPPPRSTRR